MGEVAGLICVVVASVFFGSNFVVTKKYKTGDGVFFQFCMCCGILLTGLVVNTAQGTPPLQPLAMLGGALWCLGNVWVVPIVKAIGMGLGLLIWGSANMLAGWSSGKWGYLFLGLKQQKVENPALNYAGVAVALVGLVIYSFVTPTESKASQRRDDASERNASMSGSSAGSRRRGSETAPLVTVADGGGAHSYGHDLEARSSAPAEAADEEMFVDRMTPAGKKTFGVAASVVSGIFYGVNFDPPQYLMNHGHSQDALDYVFSHFLGLFFTSLLILVVYSAAKRNRPVLFPEIILPGMLSGVMWAVAQTCWFKANAVLEFVVAFPLVTTGPGIIGALWGVFVFGEITGRRNFLILGSAIAVSLLADVLIVLSKPQPS